MLLEKIKSTLQPEPRAIATAATFEEFIKVSKISMADLKYNLEFLSKAQSDDEAPNITARRKTCAEIAALIDENDGFKNYNAWGAWVLCLEREVYGGDDSPRTAAMLETARREYREIYNK